MTPSLAVVCEGPADERTGCGLAERVFCDKVTSVAPQSFKDCWRGVDTVRKCVFWRELKGIARLKGIRLPHGHFEGEPAKSDAAAARRALRVLMAADAPPQAVVLLRDEDRDGQRRQGLEQARREARLAVAVVVGVANPMRESWVLAGFDPQNDGEQSRLKSLCRELGLDPREKSHLLRARHDADKNSPKRVLRVLTDGYLGREESCWQDTALDTLRRRGKENGLADYLNEVENDLVPLFSTSS